MRFAGVWLIFAACSPLPPATTAPPGEPAAVASAGAGPAAPRVPDAQPAAPREPDAQPPAPRETDAPAPDARPGSLEITGHVSVTTLDEPTDEAVRQGQVRFTIDNRSRQLVRVKPREIELFHP